MIFFRYTGTAITYVSNNGDQNTILFYNINAVKFNTVSDPNLIGTGIREVFWIRIQNPDPDPGA